MAHQLSIPPCCLDPASPLHPPPLDKPLRIHIEGPKSSIEKLLPGITWHIGIHEVVFPQLAGPELAALAYSAVYGQEPSEGSDDMVVTDEYLGLIMKPVQTGDIDYYGVTFDHRVPLDDDDPDVLQINILEMEEDNGKYAKASLLFRIDPADYVGWCVLAVPRCCQKRKGTTDRVRINSSVWNRRAQAAGVPWEERWEHLQTLAAQAKQKTRADAEKQAP